MDLYLHHRDAERGCRSDLQLRHVRDTLMHASSKCILNQRRRSPGTSFREKLSGWLILVAFLCACVWLVFFTTGSWMATSLLRGALAGLGWVPSVARSRKLGKLAVTRSGESICQFARSFDLRDFDPVLIRAVSETVQAQAGSPPVPLRSDDRLVEELELDGDDLEEIIREASLLAGRSLEKPDLNSLYGRIFTVRHVVEFLHHQPRNEAA